MLQGSMTETDKYNINSTETYELLQMMRIPQQKQEHPEYWIEKSISKLLEEDLDHPNTGQYIMDNKTIIHRTSKPDIPQYPSQISTNIRPKGINQVFRKWEEMTEPSLSGRHIGHYKAILDEPDIMAFNCKML